MGTCELDAKKTKTCPIINSLKRKLGVISGDISHTDLIKKVESLLSENEKLKDDNKKLQDIINTQNNTISKLTSNKKEQEKIIKENKELTIKCDNLSKTVNNQNKEIDNLTISISNSNDYTYSTKERHYKKIRNKGASESVKKYNKRFTFDSDLSGKITLKYEGIPIGTFEPDDDDPLFGRTTTQLGGGAQVFAKHGLNMLGALMYECLIQNEIIGETTSTQ